MKKRLIALLILGLALLGAHALATPNLNRTESTKAVDVVNVSTQEKTESQTPQNAPEEKQVVQTPTVPEPTPQPTPVDPNGCEAKGMYWRADNYECIAKPVATQSVTPVAKTSPTGTGDCSLVNNYDWPVATAMRVCMQESGGNPNNANWKDDHTSWAGCMGSFGLFQINCSQGQVYDGPQNVAIAYSMWKGSGGTFWKHWPNTCAKVGC
jgi:Tfp pilus assembly protein PilV